jgi:protein phosphatase
MKPVAFGLSDVGRCRESNEDSFLCDTKLGLFAVADGMGGHAAGEVASRLAVDALVEAFRRNNWNGEARDRNDAIDRLRIAVAEANRKICDEIVLHEEQRGMGTTMVALLTLAEHAVIGHVGDSRAYLLRDQRLHRLTSDHSWVNEQVQAGLLSTDAAQKHPMRNIVTRALGSRPDVVVDLRTEEIHPGDVFLLCSDGLNGMLGDDEIRETLVRYRDNPKQSCWALVDAANQRGGEDNTTVIVLNL